MATISQVFQKKKLWEWYASTVTNKFDGASEKGQDYSTAYGTPVGVAVGGKIVRIAHNNNGINDVVELQSGDGAVWLYQHITSKVSVGQVLQCGDIIGTENGLPRDLYSTGPHIEVRYCPPGQWKSSLISWNEHWINPASIFGSLAGQTAGSIASGSNNLLGFSGSGPSGLPTLAQNPLKPNATVTSTLAWLDRQLAITNPFLVNPPPLQVLGASIPDPIGYIQDFSVVLAYDAHALVWRAAFAILGVFILYKVASTFINFDALIGAYTGSVDTLAMGLAV